MNRIASIMAMATVASPSIPALVDGDPVTEWLDSSVNGNDATQSGSARPTFKTSIVNGFPIVRFTSSGSSGLNLTSSISGNWSWCVFVVMKPTSGSVTLNALKSNGSGGHPSAAFEHSSGLIYIVDRNEYKPYTNSWSGGFHVFTTDARGTGTLLLNVDGTLQSAGAGGSATNTGDFITIGSDTIASGYSDGDIAEIVVYNTLIGLGDKANVEKYLGDKYGITVAGGSNVQPDTVTGLSGWWKADSLGDLAATLTSGLTAYYALEDLTEEVGGLTLTDHGTVTFTTGKVNNAANFVAASSRYLSRADNAAFQFGTGTNFTVAAWMKSTSSGAFVTGVCYGKVYGSALGWTLTFSSSGITAGLGFNSASNTFTPENHTFNDGAWHLAIATFDRAGNMICYVDNTLEGSVSISANNGLTINNSVGFQIGAANGGDFFDGSVDEVGIWNRILTGAEMTALWNGGAGTTYPF